MTKPMFTTDEQLLIEAAAALKLAQEMAAHVTQPDTTTLQKQLMDRVHEMRVERLGLGRCC